MDGTLLNGLHFNRVAGGSLPDGDVEFSMGLVSRCFGTLESIIITFCLVRAFAPASVFGPCTYRYLSAQPCLAQRRRVSLPNAEHSTTLQTIKSESLQ